MRGQVLETHCRAAFIKQVLPRLLRPVAPLMVGTEDRQAVSMGRESDLDYTGQYILRHSKMLST